MPKEILVYQPIYSYTAEEFISQMEQSKQEDVVIRMNCPGGDVQAGFGMIAKMAEHTKGALIKVDGAAASMGAYMLCYAKDAEGLDISKFLLHRASFGDYTEKNKDLFTDALRQWLDNTNTSLRNALTAKVNEEKFTAITGKTFDQLFSMEGRLDVTLNAEQAKELGLINRIVKLTPEKKQEIKALALASVGMAETAELPEPITQTVQTIAMNIQELKAKHPEVYAEAMNAGVAQERARVQSFMAFINIDPATAAAAIKEGKEVTPDILAKMAETKAANVIVGAANAGSAAAINTTEQKDVNTEQADAFAVWQTAVKKELGLVN
jgi:ATP-dependent protease ClpP protease subunit